MTSLSVERGSSDRSPETIPASDCGQCAIATNPGWTLVTFYPATVGVQTKMPHFVEAPIACCRTEYSQGRCTVFWGMQFHRQAMCAVFGAVASSTLSSHG